MTSFSNYGPTAPGFRSGRWQGACSGRWRPFEIVALVISFAFWWPLGLAVLAFKLAQRRGYNIDEMVARAQGAFPWFSPKQQARAWQPFAHASTGNSAFDDWRTAEMARIEEERRKLDAAQKEFAEHLDNLRRARDKDEFDSFMAARHKPAPSA